MALGRASNASSSSLIHAKLCKAPQAPPARMPREGVQAGEDRRGMVQGYIGKVYFGTSVVGTSAPQQQAGRDVGKARRGWCIWIGVARLFSRKQISSLPVVALCSAPFP